MPFRIVVVLLGGIFTTIVALVSPYLGTLALVVLNFARPQDDRPNVAQLHIPWMVHAAVLLGTFVRWGEAGKHVMDAIKRLKFVLLLFGLMVLSASTNWTAACEKRIDEFSTVMVFCVLTLAWIKDEKTMRGYINTLLLSGGYVASVAIRNPSHISEQIGNDKFQRLALGKGGLVWGNSNYLALLMVLVIFLTLASLKYYKKLWQKIPLLLLLAAAFFTFFRANSRGASIALAIGLMTFWWVSKNKAKSLFLFLILAAVGASFVPDSYWTRLSTVARYQQDESATTRLELWQIALDLIQDHPALGVGPDNFELYAPNTPHNAYLQIASEMGMPALLVYIFIVTSSVARALQIARGKYVHSSGHEYAQAISLGLLCCCMAVVVQGFTTGLAHREMVYVMTTLTMCLRKISVGNAPVEEAETEENSQHHPQADSLQPYPVS